MTRFKHHKYTWSKPHMSIRHSWEFIGPFGAISFNVTLTPGYDASCGLEYHHTAECNYRPETPPDHVDCPLTGGRCWHDGTSLYASEHVWPAIKGFVETGNHDVIFRYLEGCYADHFDKYEKRGELLETVA